MARGRTVPGRHRRNPSIFVSLPGARRAAASKLRSFLCGFVGGVDHRVSVPAETRHSASRAHSARRAGHGHCTRSGPRSESIRASALRALPLPTPVGTCSRHRPTRRYSGAAARTSRPAAARRRRESDAAGARRTASRIARAETELSKFWPNGVATIDLSTELRSGRDELERRTAVLPGQTSRPRAFRRCGVKPRDPRPERAAFSHRCGPGDVAMELPSRETTSGVAAMVRDIRTPTARSRRWGVLFDRTPPQRRQERKRGRARRTDEGMMCCS